jgi:hypothetical protein
MNDRSASSRRHNVIRPGGLSAIARMGAGVAFALALGISVVTHAPSAQAGDTCNSCGGSPPAHQPHGGTLGPSVGWDLVDIGQWAGGVPGLANSAGKLGWTSSSILGPDGLAANIVGINKQFDQIGPAVLDLKIVKGAGITITPPHQESPCPPDKGGRTVGPSVTLDLVDIGQWTGRIPGLATSTGKLGWTSKSTLSRSGLNFNIVGFNQQSDQIGPANFNLGIVKGASFNITPPGTKPPGGKPGGDKPHKPGDDKPHKLGGDKSSGGESSSPR